jgi:hypothetical protein
MITPEKTAKPASVGDWIMFRDCCDQLKWSGTCMVATEDILAARNPDGSYGDPKSERPSTRALDIVWVSKLSPPDMADLIAKQAAELIYERQNYGEAVQSRNDTRRALEEANAEIERLRNECNRAWQQRNVARTTVSAWEQIVCLDPSDPFTLFPSREWGPEIADVAVQMPSPQKLTLLLSELADLRKALKEQGT